MQFLRIKLVCLWALTISGVAGVSGVRASGIAVDELSVRRLGDAFSGGAAEAADASVVWYNPAGMTRLGPRELSAGLSVIPHKTRFSGAVYFIDSDGNSVLPVTGHNKAWAGMEWIPDLYTSFQLADDVWLGFSVNSPWGTGTEFDKFWVGRYQSVKSSLLTVNLTSSLAWKVCENISVGMGLMAEYAEGEIQKAVPLPPTGQVEDDSFFKGAGNHNGFGFSLGLLYQPFEVWQFGFLYRGKIRHKLDGNMSLYLQPVAETEKVKAQLDITIPESYSFSAIHWMTPGWSVKADASLTRWSCFDELVFKPNETGSLINRSEVQSMEWHDTWRLALGTEYQLSDCWQIRAGMAYDNASIPNHAVTVDFALDDYRAISVGATYRVNANFEVDLAGQHTWTTRRTIHETVKLNDTPVVRGDGEVTNRINSFGIGILWRF